MDALDRALARLRKEKTEREKRGLRPSQPVAKTKTKPAFEKPEQSRPRFNPKTWESRAEGIARRDQHVKDN